MHPVDRRGQTCFAAQEASRNNGPAENWILDAKDSGSLRSCSKPKGVGYWGKGSRGMRFHLQSESPQLPDCLGIESAGPQQSHDGLTRTMCGAAFSSDINDAGVRCRGDFSAGPESSLQEAKRCGKPERRYPSPPAVFTWKKYLLSCAHDAAFESRGA